MVESAVGLSKSAMLHRSTMSPGEAVQSPCLESNNPLNRVGVLYREESELRVILKLGP